MITLHNYITANHKYQSRLQSPELTQEVKDNATKLLKAVNSLLIELGIDVTGVEVSSGFRPSSINGAIGGAKKSLHMRGLAVDLVDYNGHLCRLIEKNYDLLAKYGLWMEHPESTKGWCHLDLGSRADRRIRIFKP